MPNPTKPGRTLEERIGKIIDKWFLREPPLFQVICRHEVARNPHMPCALRSGRRRIEYNPGLLNVEDSPRGDIQLEQMLRAEAIRIILKHPYMRRPQNCSPVASALGSDTTISDNYDTGDLGLPTPESLGLPPKMFYEWYSTRIQEMLPGMEECSGSSTPPRDGQDQQPGGNSGADMQQQLSGGDNGGDKQQQQQSGGNNSGTQRQQQQSGGNHNDGNQRRQQQSGGSHPGQGGQRRQGAPAPSPFKMDGDDKEALSGKTELWEDDALSQQEINDIIEGCTDWGSLKGDLVERIKASAKAKLDWRHVLSGFRSSVLSSRRKLTRMRPNRRTGFDNMGSIRQFVTRMLVAVDTSASITPGGLSNFYGVVNSAFKYGFQQVDYAQFDAGIQEVGQLRNIQVRAVEVKGRGGTNYQDVIDYAGQKGYDGIVILTDGYAPEPEVPAFYRPKILWVCDNGEHYDANKDWMRRTGRVCYIDL